MEDTIRRLAKRLGASSVEAARLGVRFMVEDSSGATLRVSIEPAGQRVMAVLVDAAGVTRCSFDLAPISEAFEPAEFPGRITLRVSNQLLHVDSQPSLGLELESIEPEHRSQSQRLRLARAESD